MVDIVSKIREKILNAGTVTCTVVVGYGSMTPDDLVYIRLIDGDDSIKYFDSVNCPGVYKPRVRVTSRAKDYVTAYQNAVAVKEVFLQNRIEDNVGVFLDGDVYDAGYDEINRKEFELNYRTLIVN